MNWNKAGILVALVMMSKIGCPCDVLASSVDTLSNDRIKIVINADVLDKGHFSIETTNGEPNYTADDQQPLIYGRPIPWTSFTTLSIDGVPYLFGGESRRLAKRSGQPLAVGTTSQQKKGHKLITKSQFNQVQAIQSLSIVENPSTKVHDSVLIEYDLINQDSISHTVGLRIVLDTMLGSNDGAPLRFGNQAIVSETEIDQPTFPFWQAFDSLVNPSIVAQGTLDMPELGVHPPNRLILANWGGLAANPWDFTVRPGRGFVRDGEDEPDTALALYWNPIVLAPGESRQIRTIYGMGSVTRALGDLVLGLSAPLDVSSRSKKLIPIVGYITNNGAFDSYNTSATLAIPNGFEVVEGSLRSPLFKLKVGETKQLIWKIRANKPLPGTQLLSFNVSSDTLQPNRLDRAIKVYGLLTPNVFISVPDLMIQHRQMATTVSVVIVNTNTSPIQDITVEIEPMKLLLPWFELQKKRIPYLGPGQHSKLDFIITPSSYDSYTGQFSIIVHSSDSDPLIYQRSIDMIHPSASIQTEISHPTLRVNQYGFIKLSAIHTHLVNASLRIEGDSIKPIRMSHDSWVTSKDWQVEGSSILFNKITVPKSTVTPIVWWHFKAIKPGSVNVITETEFGTSRETIIIEP